VNYVIAGSIALIYFPASLTATSNANSLAITGLPSLLQPVSTTSQTGWMTVEDNGVIVQAQVTVQSGSGTVSFAICETTLTSNRIEPSLTGFTSSGTKGIVAGTTFAYSLI